MEHATLSMCQVDSGNVYPQQTSQEGVIIFLSQMHACRASSSMLLLGEISSLLIPSATHLRSLTFVQPEKTDQLSAQGT